MIIDSIRQRVLIQGIWFSLIEYHALHPWVLRSLLESEIFDILMQNKKLLAEQREQKLQAAFLSVIDTGVGLHE